MAASERATVRRRLRALHGRYSRAQRAMKAYEEERTALYIEARALVPPMTFKEIADIFGVTEAAVMQKVKRYHDAERAKRAKRRPRHTPVPESVQVHEAVSV